MNKQCSKCKKRLPIDSFGKKSGGAYKSACKPCLSGYAREVTAKNRTANEMGFSLMWLRKRIV